MKDIRNDPDYPELKRKFLEGEISIQEAIDALIKKWVVDPWYIISCWLDGLAD